MYRGHVHNVFYIALYLLECIRFFMTLFLIEYKLYITGIILGSVSDRTTWLDHNIDCDHSVHSAHLLPTQRRQNWKEPGNIHSLC